MSYPNNFSSIHVELTDKCQASCPMCARNYNGGSERPFVGRSEITLEKFKLWFDPTVLKQIDNFYACGNYGDPIIARDCLEIMDYVRQHSEARIGIHTNGGARTTEWWSNLAKVLHGPHEVTFGIDGFADSHVLYRRGTNWNKIIENAKAFIDNGGYATVDCLVFKHNQHEVDDFKKEMLSLGFKSINFKSTQRFYDMEKFPVQDKSGEFEYNLEPSTITPYKKISLFKLKDIQQDMSIWEEIVNNSIIEQKCANKKEIYIDSFGNVLPCCWVGSDLLEEPLSVSLPIHDLRNKLVENTKENFKLFSQLNLDKNSLLDTLNSEAWQILNNTEVKPWICVKNCTK